MMKKGFSDLSNNDLVLIKGGYNTSYNGFYKFGKWVRNRLKDAEIIPVPVY